MVLRLARLAKAVRLAVPRVRRCPGPGACGMTAITWERSADRSTWVAEVPGGGTLLTVTRISRGGLGAGRGHLEAAPTASSSTVRPLYGSVKPLEMS